MSRMLHPVFNWFQPVRQWILSSVGWSRFFGRIQAALLLSPDACLQPMEQERFEGLRSFESSVRSGLRLVSRDLAFRAAQRPGRRATKRNKVNRPSPGSWGLTASLLVLLFTMQVRIVPAVSTDDIPPHSPCSAPEYRQFDFWLGDWDAFDFGGRTVVARLRVDRLLDGCVLREAYEGVDGHKGQSLNIYDSSRQVWHQSWVTNRAELLTLEGTFQAGEMVLTGADRTAGGKERRVRGVWKPEDGGVRETAVTSTDGGKTWKPWFDLVFRPHKSYR